jgi:hypothetical protein
MLSRNDHFTIFDDHMGKSGSEGTLGADRLSRSLTFEVFQADARSLEVSERSEKRTKGERAPSGLGRRRARPGESAGS